MVRASDPVPKLTRQARSTLDLKFIRTISNRSWVVKSTRQPNTCQTDGTRQTTPEQHGPKEVRQLPWALIRQQPCRVRSSTCTWHATTAGDAVQAQNTSLASQSKLPLEKSKTTFWFGQREVYEKLDHQLPLALKGKRL